MKTLTVTGEYDYLLRCYEKDFYNNLKEVSVLNFMQDAATLHADYNDFGTQFVLKNNLAWYVLKYKVVFYKYFSNMEKITVKTETRGASRLFAYRDFYFYCNGELFAKATSLWALINFETKKMVKVSDLIPAIGNYEKREDDLEFEKIKLPETFDIEKEFRVRFDDFDINQHVNNASYLVWALETFDFEFRKENKIKSFEINYKRGVDKEGRIVSKLTYDRETKTSVHSICEKESGEECCSLKLEWL